MDFGSMVPYLKEPLVQQIVTMIVAYGSIQSIDFDFQPYA